MKIIVAPNAFKDSMTTGEAAAAIASGLLSVDPLVEIVQVPVADGGDGLFDVFRTLFTGERIRREVTGPRFETIEAEYLYVPDSGIAVVEMARASGLALLPPERRDARATTTLGTGQLVADALDRGAKRVIVGIGGSATNDGGVGFASALGARFLDAGGKEIRPIGEDLHAIRHIDVSGMREDVSAAAFEAICDVDNPLCGVRGAAAVYGPQKGATPGDIVYLDAGLANLAELVRNCLGKDIKDMPGAGAAGGLGFGLAVFAGAKLRPGIDVILDLVEIDRHLKGADLAVTAEGRIDFQTAFGKGPAGVGARAKRQGVPCLALAGGVAGDISNLHAIGIDAAFSICSGPMKLEDAMRDGRELLAAATAQVFRAFLAGGRRR